jgi:hypothetical protein
MDSHGLLLLLTSLSDAMALPFPFLGGSDMTWCLARCPPRRSPRSQTKKESRDRWYFVRHPNHMHKRRQTVWCVEERLAAGMASRGQLSSFFLNCGLERQGLDSPSAPSRTGWHPTRINRGSLNFIFAYPTACGLEAGSSIREQTPRKVGLGSASLFLEFPQDATPPENTPKSWNGLATRPRI